MEHHWYWILLLCTGIVCPIQGRTRTTWDNGCEIDLSTKIVCYYPNWAQYRPTIGFYTVDDIDPCLCTHIVYAFAGINGTDIHPTERNDLEMYAKLRRLREVNWDLKLLISVGGARLGPTPFILIAASEQKRRRFATNILNFLKRHRLDGVDIDWEYPSGVEKQNFTEMMKEIKRTFEEDAGYTGNPRKLVASALGGSRRYIESSYDLPQLSKVLDLGLVMSYDLWGAWTNMTGFHSALYGYPGAEELSQDWIIQAYLNGGMAPEKMVIGIPTYGRSFTLYNESDHRPYAKAYETGAPGPQTQTPGILSYYEICRKKKMTVIYDEVQQSPYGYIDDLWVAFDDLQSVRAKKEIILNNSLAGVMFWDLSQDDFGNFCGQGKYPLISVFDPNGSSYTSPVSYVFIFTCVIGVWNLIHQNH